MAGPVFRVIDGGLSTPQPQPALTGSLPKSVEL
jgi:hypothetical protein